MKGFRGAFRRPRSTRTSHKDRDAPGGDRVPQGPERQVQGRGDGAGSSGTLRRGSGAHDGSGCPGRRERAYLRGLRRGRAYLAPVAPARAAPGRRRDEDTPSSRRGASLSTIPRGERRVPGGGRGRGAPADGGELRRLSILRRDAQAGHRGSRPEGRPGPGGDRGRGRNRASTKVGDDLRAGAHVAQEREEAAGGGSNLLDGRRWVAPTLWWRDASKGDL